MSVGAVANFTLGLSPSAPYTAKKLSVEPVERVSPAKLTVAVPTPLLPTFTRKTLALPVKFNEPIAIAPSVPLRLMYENAPPSKLMGVAEDRRLFIAWIPESSHCNTALRTVTLEVPDRRP